MSYDINSEQCPVQKVFSDDFAFSIPYYQRPFAWKIDQSAELCKDLVAALDQGGADPYFLGSIVLTKAKAPESEIIDGQQRLTTLTILLAALRASIPDTGNTLTRYIFEAGNTITGTPERFRLRVRELDRDFFERYIQTVGGITRLKEINDADISESQQRIVHTANLYMNFIANMVEGKRRDLANFVLTRCLFIVISTPDFDSAYRIFSRLNSRGLDLTMADRLKADILRKIVPEKQESYTRKWEDLEENLGNDGFEDLIGFIRGIYSPNRSSKSILSDFNQYVLSKYPVATDLIDTVFVSYGKALSNIVHKDYAHSKVSLAQQINTLLQWLMVWRDKDWQLPAIVMMARHQNDPQVLLNFLTDLERLVVGLMITDAGDSKRETRYRMVLTEILANKNLQAKLSALQLTDEEQKTIILRLNGDVYHLDSPVRRYILQRLDAALSGGDARYLTSFTVEHVLPQRPAPDSQWMQWFPTRKDRDAWVHRLANLVLLNRDKNSEAENYDFTIKKKIYFLKDGATPYALTSQVVAHETWTPAILTLRQTELLSRLRALWRI